tara:strand:+ start:3606 stop:5117 length:1512 start_codon:yes stop_codon:yes gene_type:complete
VERLIINQKKITQLISGKKRIRLSNASILTADVEHIIAKDIIELYLKLNFCRKINWIDIYGNERSTSNIITNGINLIKNLVSFPFIKRKVKNAISKELSDGNIESISFEKELKIQYIRSDHWFNLKSGGSVGHTSGVIGGLVKKGVLQSVVSTSKLFNLSWLNNYIIASPDYSKTGNIPNLPDLNYNLELINNQFNSKNLITFNAIYQRSSLGNFFGIYLRRKYNLPLILEFNGSELWVSKNWNDKKIFFFDLLNKIEELNLKFADKIIVVSEVLKSDLIGKGFKCDKILVNPNGVDTSIYRPNCGGVEVRKKLGLTNENVVGFIGTFGVWHGAIVMAKAIVDYCSKFPEANTKFLLIGEGNDLPEVKKIINNSNIQEKVIFTGRIDQSDGPAYLDACDLLLSPHIPNPDGSDFFGSPTKLFEYMAMEKPIIASRLNQIGDILEDGKTAVLIEPNDPYSLSKSINELILDKDLRAVLGKNARDEVVKNYSWDKHVERLLNFIN